MHKVKSKEAVKFKEICRKCKMKAGKTATPFTQHERSEDNNDGTIIYKENLAGCLHLE